MRAYLISAAVAVTSVAVALGFFFAGYWIRGAAEQPRTVAAPVSVGQTALTTAPPAVTAPAPAVGPTAPAVFAGSVRVDGSPARGPENALVTMVEFSDFQCPFCKAYSDQTHPLIHATYGSRLRYVFRDFPIATLHPQAPKAAEAGQCAFEQGRFWEFRDRLFQNPGALDVANLKVHAEAVGLDGGAFSACLDSGRYAQRVQQSFDEGRSAGVSGTPTFFINGRKLVGAQPFATFQKILEEEFAKANGAAPLANSGQ